MTDVRKAGGWCLVGAAGAIVIAMGHHPSGHQSGLAGPVHGAMIFLVWINAFGFAVFALARGPVRAPILAGALAFAIAVLANIGAATINGFVAPALAREGAGVGRDVFQFAWAVNQTLAWLGVIATGVAFLLWSADLLRREAGHARLVGIAGLVAGALPVALLLAGVLWMDVTGAFIVYGLQAVWSALVGLLLLAEAAAGTREPA